MNINFCHSFSQGLLWLFKSDKRQNGWTDQAQILLWDITWSQERFMDGYSLKKIALKIWFFIIHKKIDKKATIKS